jgi:hypothetical protein
MSDRSLTGYDNRDANSGVADEEVYLYDAQSHRLACASCDPTGARPVGVFDNQEAGHELIVDEVHAWSQRWLAASIPGWDGNSSQGTVAQYQPRYLSDSGRLFFDSADALAPQDTNGLEDVYEYEPEGVGACASSGGAFSEKAGGCISLISSGTSREESALLDASESGGDVFFLTSARLLPQDTDTAFDVYDAHVCGGEGVPCSSAALSPPPCTTADACRTAPTPQPSLFGAPSSATFIGVGNGTPVTSPIKARPPSRAQELARALKACRRNHNKHKRSSCERLAHKKYPSKASKSSRSR